MGIFWDFRGIFVGFFRDEIMLSNVYNIVKTLPPSVFPAATEKELKMIKTINLSFDPSSRNVPQKVSSKQFDNLSRKITVRLSDIGSIVDVIDNATVLLRGTRPDSAVFDIVGTQTENSALGQFDFVLTESALAVSGEICCDVVCSWDENGETKSCSTVQIPLSISPKSAVKTALYCMNPVWKPPFPGMSKIDPTGAL